MKRLHRFIELWKQGNNCISQMREIAEKEKKVEMISTTTKN